MKTTQKHKPSKKDIESFYHVPFHEAALSLDVTQEMLRNLCREYGIEKYVLYTIDVQSAKYDNVMALSLSQGTAQ